MNKRTRRPTLPPVNPELEQIARDVLRFETLTPRNSDSLDFKDCGVGCVREALERAFAAGARQATAAANVEPHVIARYQTGGLDMHQMIVVEQRAADAFAVVSYESCDGEASRSKSTPFTTARSAFGHALRLVTDEVADLITEDVLDG